MATTGVSSRVVSHNDIHTCVRYKNWLLQSSTEIAEDVLAFNKNLKLTCDFKCKPCRGQCGFPSLFITCILFISFYMCIAINQHTPKLHNHPKVSVSIHIPLTPFFSQPSVSSVASPLSPGIPNMDVACSASAIRFSRSSGLRTRSSATKVSGPQRARPKAPPCNAETLRLWFLLISWSDLSWVWLKWLETRNMGQEGRLESVGVEQSSVKACRCPTSTRLKSSVTELTQNNQFCTRRLHEITSRKKKLIRPKVSAGFMWLFPGHAYAFPGHGTWTQSLDHIYPLWGPPWVHAKWSNIWHLNK